METRNGTRLEILRMSIATSRIAETYNRDGFVFPIDIDVQVADTFWWQRHGHIGFRSANHELLP